MFGPRVGQSPGRHVAILVVEKNSPDRLAGRLSREEHFKHGAHVVVVVGPRQVQRSGVEQKHNQWCAFTWVGRFCLVKYSEKTKRKQN